MYVYWNVYMCKVGSWCVILNGISIVHSSNAEWRSTCTVSLPHLDSLARETVAVPYSYFDALLYMYRNTSENLWEVNLLPLQPHSAQMIMLKCRISISNIVIWFKNVGHSYLCVCFYRLHSQIRMREEPTLKLMNSTTWRSPYASTLYILLVVTPAPSRYGTAKSNIFIPCTPHQKKKKIFSMCALYLALPFHLTPAASWHSGSHTISTKACRIMGGSILITPNCLCVWPLHTYTRPWLKKWSNYAMLQWSEQCYVSVVIYFISP